MTSAKVIKDTCSGKTRLITVEVEFHRFILPEVNTHRCLSRNYQSSRAIPVEKTIEQVRNNPAMPVHWGKNQRGMQAELLLDNVSAECVEDMWLTSAENAANSAEYMKDKGCHKQVVNRILEPFVWTKGVVTATQEGWDSFFALRIHKDAQPEIKLLAEKIKEAVGASFCQVLLEGEWHLPYVDNLSEFESIQDAIKVSASSCAQVSYRVLDTSLEKARRIYDMLNLPEKGVYKEDPAHFSPCEHVAMATSEYHSAEELGLIYSPSDISGNFQTMDYFQYRKALQFGDEGLLV